jgi:hypothetical protein
MSISKKKQKGVKNGKTNHSSGNYNHVLFIFLPFHRVLGVPEDREKAAAT